VAPIEVRGEWKAAATSVPGIQICDQLPKLASLVDRITIIRSMSHDDNNPAFGTAWPMAPRTARWHLLETTPADVLATVYHLMGIAPETTIPNRLGRPVRFVANGDVIDGLLSWAKLSRPQFASVSVGEIRPPRSTPPRVPREPRQTALGCL